MGQRAGPCQRSIDVSSKPSLFYLLHRTRTEPRKCTNTITNLQRGHVDAKPNTDLRNQIYLA